MTWMGNVASSLPAPGTFHPPEHVDTIAPPVAEAETDAGADVEADEGLPETVVGLGFGLPPAASVASDGRVHETAAAISAQASATHTAARETRRLCGIELQSLEASGEPGRLIGRKGRA